MQTEEPAEDDRTARAVLSHFWGEVAARDVFFRRMGGGFSGSRVWEVICASGQRYCLKRWPIPGPGCERLGQIHRLLATLAEIRQSGLLAVPCVPVPIAARDGKTWTEVQGRLWELAPLLEGKAIEPCEVTFPHIAAAMQGVAALHVAMEHAARAAPSDFSYSGTTAPSPSLKKRRELANRWYSERAQLTTAIVSARLPEPIRQKCTDLLNFSLPHLKALVQEPIWGGEPLPLAPCVGDLWYAHVLFKASQVTGIIDFGSSRIDSVVTDLARLLGSWNVRGAEEVGKALDIYSSFRPLTHVERAAFMGFDRTSRVLSALQWIEWLAVEQRSFADWDAVSARLDFVLARLPI
jgi:Ser/Thr protein kinase RdoA (MazF antagonist)